MTDDGAFNCPSCDVMCEPLDIALLAFPDDSGKLLYKQSLNLFCPQCGRRFVEILGEDVVLEEDMEEDEDMGVDFIPGDCLPEGWQ